MGYVLSCISITSKTITSFFLVIFKAFMENEKRRLGVRFCNVPKFRVADS